MDKEWNELSPEQKREKRLSRFFSTEGIDFVSPEAENAYRKRAQRMISVYNVAEPDRVPVNINIGTLPLRLAGVDLHTGLYDYDKLIKAYTEFNEKYDIDSYASPMIIPARMYDLLDYKLYVWPGHGLPGNAAGVQFVEGEYMQADEYDALIKDPTGFFLRVYMPRIFGALEPFKKLTSVMNVIELPGPYFMPYTEPEMQKVLQTLADIGRELSGFQEMIGKHVDRGKELGFPTIGMGSFGKAPFDTIGDTLRGTQGIMMDMYRKPDKLLEALDVIAEMAIDSIIANANQTGGFLATFPLHKGADGWMSQKQFDTFYWPSLKKIIDALIEEGIIVHLFAEGSYDTRLESVNEFPRGAVEWLFEKTDMARAKEILGESCCISGNVSASMLVTGTPSEVKEYCHKLIDVCGRGGGFILAPGAGVDEAKVKNLTAMVEAAKEYGVYK